MQNGKNINRAEIITIGTEMLLGELVEDLVREDRFHNLVTDAHHRIQGGHRLLKDHRNL